MTQTTEKKGGLQIIVEEALSKGTEKERILAVLDCIKGYKCEYDQEAEKAEYNGFIKCKNEYRNQIYKIKNFVNNSL